MSCIDKRLRQASMLNVGSKERRNKEDTNSRELDLRFALCASQGTSSLHSSLVITQGSWSWTRQRSHRQARSASAYRDFFRDSLPNRTTSLLATDDQFQSTRHSREASHIQPRHPAKSLALHQSLSRYSP